MMGLSEIRFVLTYGLPVAGLRNGLQPRDKP